MDSFALDVLAVDSSAEEYLYMEGLLEDSLEAASVAQILDCDEYFALLNNDHSEAEAC